MNGREVFIFDAVRTARGKAKPTGSLHHQRPIDLVAGLMHALTERNDMDSARIDDVVLGCVTQTAEQGANLAKTAALYAGWASRVPGATVNRFCASGLEAVHIAALQVATGTADLVACGGVESMSRVPMFSDQGPWFADREVARVTGFWHMGAAADLVATRAGIDRPRLDRYAAESQRRAAAATAGGRFERSLVPIAGADRDELIRDGVTAATLAELAPAFADQPRPVELVEPIEARHTVATSPGMCDGASLLLVGSREAGREVGLEPRARIAGMATASADPVTMLTGNLDATRKLLDRAALGVDDIDCFEVNESFAVVPLQFADELRVAAERLNPNGGAIAMGHPLGATGGVLLATLIDELHRNGGHWGVASICGGAGVAAATLIQRV